MTISFFSEVAHHPATLWISVAKTAYSHELISKVGQFSLAVLNLRQKSLAINCGTVSGRHQDKCGALDLFEGPGGLLFLRGALASTACRIRHCVDLGDYTLFVADILETYLDSHQAHMRHLLLSDLVES